MTQKQTDALKTANRREFLRTTAAAAAAASVFRPTFTFAAEGAKGANERIGVGFIGTGGRCQAHIDIVNQLKARGRCEPVAVCDIYGPRAAAAAQKTGGKIYSNHKDLLADPRVDVVCIATPDRHHAPQAIDAVPGKDVYCEKPLTHWSQMDLARQLGQEAEKHRRIVQVGTQFVADDAYAEIHKLVQDGYIGKPVHVQAGYFRRGDWGERMPIPDPKAKPGPDLDWEQFLGERAEGRFQRLAVLPMADVLGLRRRAGDRPAGPRLYARLLRLDLDYPERVLGGGGTFEYQREVPDQCNIIADYAGGPSVVLMNSLSNYVGIKTIIRGTKGIIEWDGIDGGKDRSKGARIVRLGKKEPEKFIPWRGMGDTGKLWSNFIDCVHSRQKPYSPIDIAVRVQAPLNMGILSHRASKVARFDKQKMSIVL